MRELRVFGMRRSGNHAIIEWITRHFSTSMHYNECWGWKKINSYNSIMYNYSEIENEIEITIYSYEDFAPSIEELEYENTIVILRDWYNLMSSRLVTNRNLCKFRHKKNFDNPEILKTWLDYANLYDKYRDKYILFNKWATSLEYRKTIEQKLKLPCFDDKYTTNLPISKIGNGSSFDKDYVNSKNINSRYEIVKKNYPQLYNQILNNETVELCKNIFNIEIK